MLGIARMSIVQGLGGNWIDPGVKMSLLMLDLRFLLLAWTLLGQSSGLGFEWQVFIDTF